MADPAILPAACNQLDTIRSSVNRNTSQLMVHLEPVILRTPFGPMGSTREEKEKGKRRGREKERERGEEEEREKKRRRRGNRVEAYLCRCFEGCSEICGCRLPAKVVGRLRGEEFPHLEAASSARSAWVRRLCAPRAVIVIEVMLHETYPRFPAACFLADSNTRISVLFKSRSDLTLSSGKFLILPPKCICIYTSFGKI